MDTQHIGDIIRRCRKEAKLTQADLAMLAGVGKTVVYDIETGKATVKLNTLLKILDAKFRNLFYSSALLYNLVSLHDNMNNNFNMYMKIGRKHSCFTSVYFG